MRCLAKRHSGFVSDADWSVSASGESGCRRKCGPASLSHRSDSARCPVLHSSHLAPIGSRYQPSQYNCTSFLYAATMSGKGLVGYIGGSCC